MSATGRWTGKGSGGVVGATPGLPSEASWAGVCRWTGGVCRRPRWRRSVGPGRRPDAVGGVAVGLGAGGLLVSSVEE